MKARRSVGQKIEGSIASSGDDVFLTREFRHSGGMDQVQRALKTLVTEGKPIRLGHGIYGRAEISSLSGKPILAAEGGFQAAACQALDKLGVAWESTWFRQAYNEGRSTQVPANAAVRITGWFTRRLSCQGRDLVIERPDIGTFSSGPRRGA